MSSGESTPTHRTRPRGVIGAEVWRGISVPGDPYPADPGKLTFLLLRWYQHPYAHRGRVHRPQRWPDGPIHAKVAQLDFCPFCGAGRVTHCHRMTYGLRARRGMDDHNSFDYKELQQNGKSRARRPRRTGRVE